MHADEPLRARGRRDVIGCGSLERVTEPFARVPVTAVVYGHHVVVTFDENVPSGVVRKRDAAAEGAGWRDDDGW